MSQLQSWVTKKLLVEALLKYCLLFWASRPWARSFTIFEVSNAQNLDLNTTVISLMVHK